MRKFLILSQSIILGTSILFSSVNVFGASIWQQSYELEKQKKYLEAAKLIQPKIQKSIKSEYAILRYAWLNYLAGKYNIAIDNYKLAIKYNSQSLDARLGIMLPLMAQSRWREATEFGEQVLAVAPWQYYAHIRLMACESALLLWSKLDKHASLVNEKYPSDVDTLIFLARAKINTGDKKSALKIYKKVIERLPNNAEALQFIVENILMDS